MLSAINALVDLAFGNPAISRSSTASSQFVYVDANSQAPASGTLTQVNWWRGTTKSFNITFMVGLLQGSLFHVRSTQSFSVGATNMGVVSLPCSLEVEAGDYLAVWFNVNLPNMVDSFGGLTYTAFAVNAPSAGDTISLGSTNGVMSMNVS
jgi:hypothetical protein